jgi:predicted transcriptional regulator
MKKQIKIGVADAAASAKDFIDAWKKAEQGKRREPQVQLTFESFETLLKTLTPGRWMLLKTLHKSGPMSIRSLAAELRRDYKNVHTDVNLMKNIGLVERTEDNKVEVPWDIVEARLQLAA